MTVIAPYGQEIGAKYVMTAPDGSVCSFNEPAGTNYVGPLSTITGLDSPEVRESSGMNVERDGGFDNNYLLGRRPFTLQGQIVPSSVNDRLYKIAYLNAASMALRESGKLEWTTGFGSEVFLNFRRQQPVVTSDAWVKQFFLSCVASDPRIYSTESYQQYLSVNGTISENNTYKMTFASGSSVNIIEFPFTVENGKNVQVQMWMRVNSSWTGGTPAVHVQSVAGVEEAIVPFKSAEKGKWQRVIFEFRPTASGVARLYLACGTAPTVGNYLEFTMPMLQSKNFTGKLGSEGVRGQEFAGWTKSNVFERPPYNAFQKGNYPAPTKVNLYGPMTGCKIVNTQTGEPLVQISGFTIVKGETLAVDLDKRTVKIEPGGADAYGRVNFLNTTWWGISPAPTPNLGADTIRLTNVAGAGESSGAVVEYRDTWV